MSKQQTGGKMSHNVQRALRLVMLAAGILGLFPALTSLDHTWDAVLAAGEVQTSPEAQTPPDPAVLWADETGIVLEWRAPVFSQQQVTGDDGRFYSELEAPDWMQSTVPGQPQLPVASVLAVAPPTGEVTLQVQVMEQERHPLSHPVVPAPEPVVVGTAPDATIEWVWARNERTYATGLGRSDHAVNLYPTEIVALEEAGWQRGRRLVRLTFFPLRFNPARSALDVAQRVRVTLDFSEESLQAAGGWSSDDPFIPLLQHAVINPDQVIRFARSERPVARETQAPETLQTYGPRYKLIVSREGIYELTRDALVAAGVPVTTTAYRMEHTGTEVAYQWENDGDAAFETGERMLFYARPTFTRFADYDVYWLTVGTAGAQMPVRTGDPIGLPKGIAWATTIAEQDGSGQQYLGRYLSEWDNDHWYWDRLYWDYKTGTGERDKDFQVTLPALDSGASNVTLRVHLQGTTSNSSINPDHRIQAQLNDGPPDTAEWDGNVYHTATFFPPANLLQAGTNIVRLQLPGTGVPTVEEVWLDGIELRHGISTVPGDSVRVEGEAGRNQYALGGFSSDNVHIYDVTSPAAPQVVTSFNSSGGSVDFGDADAGTATYYLLTEDQIAAPDEIVPAVTLTDPPADTDYLIITHSDFSAAVAPLAAHRAISLTVFTTTAQAIYDDPTYGNGSPDPLSIKKYISHTYHSPVTPTLDYVLLVGDGVKEDTTGQYIPPYLIQDARGPDQVPSDNRFVTMDGPNDQSADIFIGRLPVNTAAEAEIVVTKILSYELDVPQWPWNKFAIFFAGDEPTNPGQYQTESDTVYNFNLPDTFYGRRVYYCTSGCDESHEYGDITSAHNAVMRTLNSGGLFASYVGHSSVHQWDDTGSGMFHLNDIINLNNDPALPMFLQMTCFTSDFAYTEVPETLDESLLRHAGGGAIATWGPTTIGLSNGHAMLHAAFFDAVGDGFTGLGKLTEEAKLDATPGLDVVNSLDLLDTFILFGDPAMKLNLTEVSWPYEIFLPVMMRGD